MYCFQAFNHAISSALYFPELLNCSTASKSTDIQISFGKVAADGLTFSLKSGPFFQVNQQDFWLNVPKIARFLVSDGQNIIIDPYENVDEGSLRVFILDSCFKALLSQKNFVVLEGCAIKIENHAVLFVAPPGFGKSTLCSLFFKKGYTILTDEICAINQNIHLLPSYPAIHLWSNISQQLGIDSVSLKPLRPMINKYRLDIDKNIYSDPLPIKAIYTVDYHKKNSFVLNELFSKTKLSALNNALFMPAYLTEISAYNNILEKLAHDVELINLTFPRWDYSMQELGYLLSHVFDAVEADLIKRTVNHG